MIEFQPTKTQRRDTSIAAGAGVTHEEIALGLGISQPTLRKHFAYELTTGAYRKRQEVLNAMFKAAKAGNVAAQKAYCALSVKVAAPPVPLDQPAKPEGKKAQANADAVVAQAGTDWESLLTGQRVQ
jgi:predicted transcriptional regulator